MLLNKKQNINGNEKGLAVYIHWPFCKFKCPYCDFNSHVREKIDHGDWLSAYLKELQFYYDQTGDRVISSVFFGGGTPSLMEPQTVAAVIDEIDRLWGLPQGIEITLEANPTSVETQKLVAFKGAGINRVSLGVQSLRDRDLKTLGRQHSASEAMAAVELAAKIFDRYSFDLMYARPSQTLKEWQDELQEALSYGASHMSLYQLTIEEGTQYYTLYNRGDLILPDEDVSAEMFEWTQTVMDAHEMPAYEISNHAKLGEESQHNLVYWRYGDYAGVGPGAHGRLTLNGQKFATRAHRAPEVWMERVATKGHGAHDFEEIDFPKRAREILMMGLRLAEGVDLTRFEQESNTEFSDFLNQKNVKILTDEGLLDISPTRLMATRKGRQRLNAVLSYLSL